MTLRGAPALVIAAAVLPRTAILLNERGSILTAFTEKSDDFARQFVHSGTFGFVPGQPSAWTQPLYAWFLIPIDWIFGATWWAIGGVQIAVAVATAGLVYEIGRRTLSPRAGLVAAAVATLNPYLVWHDVHVNREILDQPLGAAMFLLTLWAARERSWPLAAAVGVVSGVAILSNTRLAALPLVLAAYLLWRRVPWQGAVLVLALAGVALLPWMVRNKVEVGCFTLTTDARALWKANNPATYGLLAKGIWIDAVPDPPGLGARGFVTPTQARDFYLHGGHKIDVHECAQQSYYQHLVFQFWEHHPGEKGKLMVQATGLLWNPAVSADTGGPQSGGAFRAAKHVIEPAYVIPLYALAVVGLFFVRAPVRVLAVLFAAYETVAAWVFEGTTRYRVPWDFALALLAATVLTRWPLRRTSSQYR
jgi:4-amino-4-deoxy-L-arabinose transferase-like glycosyltransferase